MHLFRMPNKDCYKLGKNIYGLKVKLNQIPKNIFLNVYFKNSGCGAGYHWSYTSGGTATQCQICPQGSYSENENSQSCTTCTFPLTTIQEGSTYCVRRKYLSFP